MKMLANTNLRTIDDFIKISTENFVQFQNSSYFKVINGEILEDSNIFRDRYFNKIMEFTSIRILNDSDINKYRFRPKRLSSDMYNTVDFWYILLMINNMTSCTDFNKRRIRVLTSDGVNFLRTIVKKEETAISKNKEEIRSILQKI